MGLMLPGVRSRELFAASSLPEGVQQPVTDIEISPTSAYQTWAASASRAPPGAQQLVQPGRLRSQGSVIREMQQNQHQHQHQHQHQPQQQQQQQQHQQQQ